MQKDFWRIAGVGLDHNQPLLGGGQIAEGQPNPLPCLKIKELLCWCPAVEIQPLQTNQQIEMGNY